MEIGITKTSEIHFAKSRRSLFTSRCFTRGSNINNKKTIKLDNTTFHRAADGTITITPKKGGGCVNIGLLIATVIVTLGGLAASINGVIQLFNPESESNPGIIVFGLFACVMFGSYALYLYSKMRSGQQQEQITIPPILNVVKIGDREIKFNDITDIAVEENPVPMMDEVVAIEFFFTLASGEKMELGRITIDGQKTEKIQKIEAEVITFLKIATKKNIEEDQYLRQRLG